MANRMKCATDNNHAAFLMRKNDTGIQQMKIMLKNGDK